MLSKSSKKILESSLKDYEINIFKSKMSFMLLDRIHNQQREINIVYIFIIFYLLVMTRGDALSGKLELLFLLIKKKKKED